MRVGHTHSYVQQIFTEHLLSTGHCVDALCLGRNSQVVLEVKNPHANVGDRRDAGLIPGSGRSTGGGYRDPLQDSCLENLMDRGAWQHTVHRVTKSQTHTLCLDIGDSVEQESPASRI